MKPIDFERNLDPSLRPSGEWHSSWQNIESILPAVLERFHVGRHSALDFGVESGYSTACLAKYFRGVIGVDHFCGDQHAGFRNPYPAYADTKHRLSAWPNITLIRKSYDDFIADSDAISPHYQFDLIHVDMEHTFDVTYGAGRWAVDHATVTLFHDTDILDWPVRKAVQQIADETGLEFWNYSGFCGLGILARKE